MKKYNFILVLAILLVSCSHKPHYEASLYAQPDPAHQGNYEARASRAMIVSQGEFSTEAGLKMYDLGGNIFDAFAAVSFVISVERPQSTGIGGGGFVVVSTPERPEGEAWDFREMAPKRAHKNMFLDSKGEVIKNLSIDGMKAVAVPGLVAGVLEIHAKYGKLPLNLVMAPAIELAKKGFPVYPHLEMAIKKRIDILKRFPSSRKIFLKRDGNPLVTGDMLVQKDLARTLMKIASHKKNGFYKGEIAGKILATSNKYGGLLTQMDLDQYQVKKRLPLIGTFKGHQIMTMPPPSSGGVHILQILNTIEGDDMRSKGPTDPKNVHLFASAMQRAFADRAEFMGDPDFASIPVEKLTSKVYGNHLRGMIEDNKATPADQIKAGQFNFNESTETTHFSIIEADGSMLASTQTINGYFGSGVVADGTGIVMNNEMDDFANKVGASNLFGAIGGKNNLVEAGKRPLSSMSPTLVFKDNKPVMALGTPNGTRILTCVANVILNFFEYEMSLFESIAFTRIHHQWSPDEIRIDETSFPPDTLRALKQYGHKINISDVGCQTQAAVFESGILHGVSDPRGHGKAAGRDL